MPRSTIDRPVSTLRQRMIEDHVNARLTIRYATRVYSFCAQLRSLRHAPDTATAEDVRRFQVY
jgi:hypothetical protein